MASTRADAHSYPFSVRIGKRKSAPHGKLNSKTAGNTNKIWKRKKGRDRQNSHRNREQAGRCLYNGPEKRQGPAEFGRDRQAISRHWQALRVAAGYRQDCGTNRACENGRVDRKRQGNLQALGDSAQAYKYCALQSC